MTILILLIATIGGAPLEPDLFAHARYVPRDVTMCVQVDRGTDFVRALRAEGLDNAIATAVLPEEITKVWGSLARATNTPERALFSDLLGTRLTLVTRTTDGKRQWAVISEIQQRVFEKVTADLRTQILTGRGGFALRRLPEQDLLLAHRGTLMIAGPARDNALLSEVLKLCAAEAIPSLADDPVLGQIEEVSPGSVNLLIRHDAPIGGWTAASLRLDEGVVRIRHASRFDSSPLTAAPPTKTLDLSLVRAFDDVAVVSIATPIDQSDGMSANFLRAVLMHGAGSDPALRDAIGERVIWVVGEADGRLAEPKHDSTLPTIAALIELRAEATVDGATIESVMHRFAQGLQRSAGCEDEPLAVTIEQQDFRVDLPAVGRALLPRTKGSEGLSLNWTVVEVPVGKWWIIASHHGHLKDVKAALARAHGAPLNDDRPLTAWGMASGARMADHLRGLKPTIRGWALPEDAFRIDTSIQRLIEMADVVDRVEWRLSKPTQNELRGEVIIKPRRMSSDDERPDRWPLPKPR